MKLVRITLTGADDRTDIKDLLALSKEHPLVEWGILLSHTRAGTPRYPSAGFVTEFVDVQTAAGIRGRVHAAAHLCGATMRDFMTGIRTDSYDGGAWAAEHGPNEREFNIAFERAQVNFNAKREGFGESEVQAMMEGWYESMDGALITQHNSANADVWRWIQAREAINNSVLRAHQILHDASGGRGLYAAQWAQPIAGMLNGYAGGLSPENVVETLTANECVVGDGAIWIDMEGALRNADDAFDLNKAAAVLEAVRATGERRGWFF